jgi:hypothetical protein
MSFWAKHQRPLEPARENRTLGVLSTGVRAIRVEAPDRPRQRRELRSSLQACRRRRVGDRPSTMAQGTSRRT